MPETAQLKALSAEHRTLDDRVRDAQIRVDDLAREQRKADADVEQVKSRRTRDRDRMDQGLITNPKDLERMQQELVSLDRRIAALEDAELEVMEQLEEAQGELSSLQAELAEVDGRGREATNTRDAKAADIHQQVGEVTAERQALVQGLPEDLIALYTKLREQKGGVGAGALRARKCTGCGMVLNAADLGVIAKAPFEAVIRCEECDRILVRTAESGI